MDYISNKIRDRISIVRNIGDNSDLLPLHQSLFEFYLIFVMGLLWNKNLKRLSEDEQEFLYQWLLKPSIGEIVGMIRKLDLDKQVGSNKKVNQAIEKYPELRNKKIGHGYTFSDGIDIVINNLETLCDEIQNSNVVFYSSKIDIISVLSKDDLCFKGLNYKSDGNFVNWSCPIASAKNLEKGNVYALLEDNQYLKLSPFVEIDDFGEKLYLYNSIEEKLSGRIKYNRLLSTGTKQKEWEDIARLCIVNDGNKIKTGNGTIINVFERNYTTFIGEGIKKSIISFLTKNKSYVCATIWGHGGVGKTATIQSVCDDLANNESKAFDYILFLSAKDRNYNTLTGNIDQISDSISTFKQLISKVNLLVFEEQSSDPQKIVEYDGKLLLIIDDYETFVKDDRDKIESFLQDLNITHHKVIITTRATSINIGLQFPTSELAEKDAVLFLLQLVDNLHLGDSKVIAQELSKKSISEHFYKITSGRPLFIYQFAYIMAQRGIQDALNYHINKQQSAIEFLYGRLYDYLSPKAKDVFVVLCLLVDEKHPVNMIDKARYILNMENDIDGFNSAVQELEKLKIIRYSLDEGDNRFFEVYSPEILQMINHYYQQRDDAFKGNCNQRREQVNNRGKSSDVEHSLLLAADANRYIKNEIEVVESYRQILNRPTAPIDVKLTAILNVAAYLVIDRGKKDQALALFKEYSYLFSNIPDKNKRRSKYAHYTKMWATYNWSSGNEQQRHKAVEILLTYARTGFNYSQNYDLELAGLLLQFNSLLLINEWQTLEDKNSLGGLSAATFKEKNSEIDKSCRLLHRNIGKPLYDSVCTGVMSKYSSGAQQNISTGLYNYLDILCRIKEFDLAVEICQYVLYNAPSHFYAQFNRKLKRIQQSRKPPIKDDLII